MMFDIIVRPHRPTSVYPTTACEGVLALIARRSQALKEELVAMWPQFIFGYVKLQELD